MLYPLKFEPILKDKIWGGTKLKNIFNKPATSDKLGESWELSGYENDESVVSNGFLAGNNLAELIEIYMGELIGDKVYDQYGLTFPLLFKLIDANDYLSIQVHPGDEMAAAQIALFEKRLAQKKTHLTPDWELGVLWAGFADFAKLSKNPKIHEMLLSCGEQFNWKPIVSYPKLATEKRMLFASTAAAKLERLLG